MLQFGQQTDASTRARHEPANRIASSSRDRALFADWAKIRHECANMGEEVSALKALVGQLQAERQQNFERDAAIVNVARELSALKLSVSQMEAERQKNAVREVAKERDEIGQKVEREKKDHALEQAIVLLQKQQKQFMTQSAAQLSNSSQHIQVLEFHSICTSHRHARLHSMNRNNAVTRITPNTDSHNLTPPLSAFSSLRETVASGTGGDAEVQGQGEGNRESSHLSSESNQERDFRPGL